MARAFPSDPFLQGGFEPLSIECDAHDLIVAGEIPRGLEGSLYRNGANPQFAPRGRYHWFDGDGMVHAFAFENGRVDYRNRWVRTERFNLERQAGEALFGGLADPGATHPSVAKVSPNAANTNIVWHAGKLLALWEGGLPTELDPRTLETKGLHDFGGKLTRRINPDIAKAMGIDAPNGVVPGIMTAHPKLDPQTGEMLMFGYSVIEPYLVYNVVDRNGRLTRSEEIDVPWASMQHDFITTSEHVIFMVFPGVFDLAAMASGGPMMSWQPDRGTMLGIMPRSGGNADVKWLRTDPCFVFHPMNAHTEGRRVICEVAQFPVLPLFEHPDQGPPLLHRWTIDLDAGSVKQERLDDVPAEFPRIDERYTGLAYAHGYAGGALRPGKNAVMFDAILHYNVRTGSRSAHALPEGSYTGEPVFVPSRPNAPEGEGYVLATVYREDERRSDLLILDAENIEKDPIGTVKLPHRIPFGFHGNWRAAKD